MVHFTLNGGDAFPLAEKVFPPDAIAAAGALFPAGGPVPGFPAFRVDFGRMPGAVSFCIWRGREPVAINFVCWDAAVSPEVWEAGRAVWPSVLGPLPKLASPKKAPWLATLLLPSVANQTKADVGWLADFEQCLALAILREEGGG